MELWGVLLTPFFYENVNLYISVTKIKCMNFILVLKSLKEVL